MTDALRDMPTNTTCLMPGCERTKPTVRGYCSTTHYIESIAERRIVEWLRALDTEPMKAGATPTCGDLMVELGAFSMLADAIERSKHRG